VNDAALRKLPVGKMKGLDIVSPCRAMAKILHLQSRRLLWGFPVWNKKLSERIIPLKNKCPVFYIDQIG